MKSFTLFLILNIYFLTRAIAIVAARAKRTRTTEGIETTVEATTTEPPIIYKKKLKCKLLNEETIYIGDINVSDQNQLCLNWNLIKNSTFTLLENVTHNKCRNPDNDTRGPFCHVNYENHRHYCNIPKCPTPLLKKATENDNCTFYGKTLKWFKEKNNIICPTSEIIEILPNQIFDECSINCQFDTNCMSFQLSSNHQQQDKTDCYLIKNVINCQVNNNNGLPTWSKRACTLKLYSFVTNEEICREVERNKSDNNARHCDEISHHIKWIKDENVSCIAQGSTKSGQEIIKTYSIKNDQECLIYCQAENSCVSFEVKVSSKDSKTCILKNVVEICQNDNDSNNTNKMQRYWIGCCRKLGEMVLNDKPRSDCAFLKNALFTNYYGQKNVSISRKQCLPWNTLKHFNDKNQFVDQSNEHAFCRNVNNDPKGPWCIVSGNFMYDYCDVDECGDIIPKAKGKVICYQGSNYENIRCTMMKHSIQWVEDARVVCISLNSSRILTLINVSALECQIKCANTPNCVSIEMESIHTKSNCRLLSKIHDCQVDLIHGSPRWAIACCQTLEITSAHGENDAAMETCLSNKTVYVGERNISKTKPCQPWTALGNVLMTAPYPYKKMQHNYCRNMNDDPRGPWCIINGSSFYDICQISQCNDSQLYANDHDICLAQYTEKCTSDYDIKWVMENNTKYCTDDNPNDIKVFVDYLPQCRDKCIESNCTSVSIEIHHPKDANSQKQFLCLMRIMTIKKCPRSNEMRMRIWRGCCKTFSPRIAKSDKHLFDCVTSTNVNNYNGDVKVTKSGDKCLKWSTTRSYLLPKYFPSNDNNLNHCRNLNADENGPWCFTSGEYGFEYCNVEACGGIFEMANEKMICYQEIIDGRIKCDEETELRWVVDKNLYCNSQTSAILETVPKTTLDICKLKCGNHKLCLSMTYKNEECTLYNVIIHCDNEKQNNNSSTIDRYYVGCCKQFKVYSMDRKQIEQTIFRVDCVKRNSKNETDSNFLYMGNYSLENRCLSWNKVRPEIAKELFHKGKTEHNYCRNLNADKKGPWCLTSGKFLIEYCTKLKTCEITNFEKVQPTEICFEDSFPERQTKCYNRKGTKLKWIEENHHHCIVNEMDILNELDVYGIVDCKERCFLNKKCISMIFEKGNDSFDGEPHHKCKLISNIPFCTKDRGSKITFITIGCCHPLQVPQDAGRKKRSCIYFDPNIVSTYDYVGKVNHTKNKKQCIQWRGLRQDLTADKFPHRNDNHNFCRNPNYNEKGPWCITTGKHFYEHCVIPNCVNTNNLRLCAIPLWFTITISTSWTLTMVFLGLWLCVYYRCTIDVEEEMEIDTDD